jgi:hypothetical protein
MPLVFYGVQELPVFIGQLESSWIRIFIFRYAFLAGSIHYDFVNSDGHSPFSVDRVRPIDLITKPPTNSVQFV